MAAKKEAKAKEKPSEEMVTELKSPQDLRQFLSQVRQKMGEDASPPIYTLAAMNLVLNRPDIYELLSPEAEEIARDIWIRLKNRGIQLRNPPILFGSEAEQAGVQ
jgi:hypothetical protein